MPFVLAGVLVLALALQVGVGCLLLQGSTFAIVLGEPQTPTTPRSGRAPARTERPGPRPKTGSRSAPRRGLAVTRAS